MFDRIRQLFTKPRPADAAPKGDLAAYTLESMIARGGMGEVWRARRNADGQRVAVKILRRDEDQPPEQRAEHLERLRREAMASSRLTSEHTVRIHDYGTGADGEFFYAMELLEGRHLGQLVDMSGPLPERRLVDLITQACEALEEAHAAGLVHRDIKPENIFVMTDSKRDFVKVLDFGLVKLLEEGVGGKKFDRGDIKKLTVAAQVVGTASFMAPEQIRGQAIDHRADLYALACVAYYLLTGAQVFEGRSETQLMFAHLQVDPEKPSDRFARKFNPTVEDVILKSLSKRADERHQSAGELAAALRGALAQ